MSDIRIQMDDHGLVRTLSTAFRRHLPKATASALNTVGFNVQKLLKRHERTDLKLTNSFIPRFTQVEKATIQKQQVEVGLLEKVYFGMRLQTGGSRHPMNHRYIAVPLGDLKRLKSGGISKTKRPGQILRNRKYFAKRGFIFYKKNNRARPVPMYVFKRITNYRRPPYLDVKRIAERGARVQFDSLLIQALSRSLGIR